MRAPPLLWSIAALLGVVVPGVSPAAGEPPEEPPFPFLSRARPPTGEPLALELRPRVGARIESSVRLAGATASRRNGGTEQVAPVALSYRTEFVCEAVTPDGESRWIARLLSLTPSESAAAAAAPKAERLRDVSGTFTLDRRGRLLHSAVEGGTPEARLAWEQTLGSPGGWPFLTFPAAPVRLGVPIPWAQSFEPARLRGLLGATDPTLEFRVEAEAVPLRVHRLGGVRALELDLQLVAEARSPASAVAGAARLRSAVRLRGMQQVALDDGLPLGTLDLTLDQSTVVRHGDLLAEVRALVQILAWVFPDTPSPAPTAQEGAQRAVRAQLASIAAALDLYRMDAKRLPADLVELTRATERLPAPYLDRVPQDPWGGAFDYRPTGNRTYRLRSPGPDGRLDTPDDVEHGG